MGGLVLVVQAVDRRFGHVRRKHDPAARHGMPAHVTLAYPFADPETLDAAGRDKLRAIFAEQPPLDLSFGVMGRFPGVLWLAPEPGAALAALTARIAEAFPEHPPYEGAFETVTPHVTLAHGQEAALDRLQARLADRLRSPVTARSDAATLFATRAGRWMPMERFPLGR